MTTCCKCKFATCHPGMAWLRVTPKKVICQDCAQSLYRFVTYRFFVPKIVDPTDLRKVLTSKWAGLRDPVKVALRALCKEARARGADTQTRVLPTTRISMAHRVSSVFPHLSEDEVGQAVESAEIVFRGNQRKYLKERYAGKELPPLAGKVMAPPIVAASAAYKDGTLNIFFPKDSLSVAVFAQKKHHLAALKRLSERGSLIHSVVIREGKESPWGLSVDFAVGRFSRSIAATIEIKVAVKLSASVRQELEDPTKVGRLSTRRDRILNKYTAGTLVNSSVEMVHAICTGALKRSSTCECCGRHRMTSAWVEDRTRPRDVQWICGDCRVEFTRAWKSLLLAPRQQV